VHGGSDGSTHRQWQEGTDYDPHIDDAMQHSRWLQIKRTLKLNNNEKTPKRGETGYEPAHKFDYLWKTIVHNVNAVTKQAYLNLTGDETSWGHQGWGEPGSGLVKRILNKPGVCKGGQIVLLCDQDRIQPCEYVHQHKLWDKPAGFTAEGPNEARMLIDKIDDMIIGESMEENKHTKKIVTTRPGVTFDNYFSGNNIFDYARQKGFGLCTTVWHNRLPKGLRI